MKNRISGYRCDITMRDVGEQRILAAENGGLMTSKKLKNSIVIFAKRKPVAVVVAGIAAGVAVGWLVKRGK